MEKKTNRFEVLFGNGNGYLVGRSFFLVRGSLIL